MSLFCQEDRIGCHPEKNEKKRQYGWKVPCWTWKFQKLAVGPACGCRSAFDREPSVQRLLTSPHSFVKFPCSWFPSETQGVLVLRTKDVYFKDGRVAYLLVVVKGWLKPKNNGQFHFWWIHSICHLTLCLEEMIIKQPTRIITLDWHLVFCWQLGGITVIILRVLVQLFLPFATIVLCLCPCPVELAAWYNLG